MLDTVISLVLYFAARYLAPDIVGDIKFVIAALQPVVVVLINSIAKEDAARLSNPSFRPDFTPRVVE